LIRETIQFPKPLALGDYRVLQELTILEAQGFKRFEITNPTGIAYVKEHIEDFVFIEYNE
jgi:hypothetical protein